MSPNELPGEDDVAAKDAALERGVELPPEGGRHPAPPEEPTGKDYLRELEKEFQDDEDRGKL
jgi:hypothetical protein